MSSAVEVSSASSEPVTVPSSLGFYFNAPALNAVDSEQLQLHIAPTIENGTRVEEGAVIAHLHLTATLTEFGDRARMVLNIVSPAGGTVQIHRPGPVLFGQEIGRVTWDEAGRVAREEWYSEPGRFSNEPSRAERRASKERSRLEEDLKEQMRKARDCYGYVNNPPQKVLAQMTNLPIGQAPSHVTPWVSLGDEVNCGDVIGHLHNQSRGDVPVYSPFTGQVVGLSLSDGFWRLDVGTASRSRASDFWAAQMIDDHVIERMWRERFAVIRSTSGLMGRVQCDEYAYREFASVRRWGGLFGRIDFRWSPGIYVDEAAERKIAAAPPRQHGPLVLDTSAYRELLMEEYDVAIEAYKRRRLIVQLPGGTGVQQWAKRNGWPAPTFGFKEVFVERALQSREDWELAWSSSGTDFYVRK